MVDVSWRSAEFVGLRRSASVGGRLLGFAFDCRLRCWPRLAGCRGWRGGRGWRGAAVVFFHLSDSLPLRVRSSYNHFSIFYSTLTSKRSSFNHISIQPLLLSVRSAFNHISIQPFPRRGRSAFNPISVQFSFKAFFHSFLLTLSSSTWFFRYFTSLSDCKVIEGYGRMDAKRE